MRMLFFKSNTFMQDDWFETLRNCGYNVDPITYVFTDFEKDDFFARKFRNRLNKISYDAVLSFNYYPILSDICSEFHIPYISWIYDSPIPNFKRFDTVENHIYHFDKIEVSEYREQGYTHIKHLPLAVNTARLDEQLSPLKERPEYKHDISFVGNLYKNRSIKNRNFVSSDYIQGILEGYAAAQTQFYNTDIATDLLEASQYIQKKSLARDFPWEYLIRSVHEEATYQERTNLLQKLSQYFAVDLYTSETMDYPSQLHLHPAVGYYTEMPDIFRYSRINLNISYRTIRSGMSARLLDIMGCGGFLMTTPQPELFDYFEPNKDFVPFYSIDELVEKCDYYLNHDEERHQIALNGYQKVKASHTYEKRFPYLFSSLV